MPYVCGAVVDGIQLWISQCEDDNQKALQFLHGELRVVAAKMKFSPLSRRALPARGGHRSCRLDAGTIRTVANGMVRGT